ncbi:hypothetical protein FM106_22380 [Brachybacterium faecium]|nr:hypothetical protein FM106_22380 [Brachybacterium faecium]
MDKGLARHKKYVDKTDELNSCIDDFISLSLKDNDATPL